MTGQSKLEEMGTLFDSHCTTQLDIDIMDDCVMLTIDELHIAGVSICLSSEATQELIAILQSSLEKLS